MVLGKCNMNALYEMTIFNVMFVVSLLSRLELGEVYGIGPSSVDASVRTPG